MITLSKYFGWLGTLLHLRKKKDNWIYSGAYCMLGIVPHDLQASRPVTFLETDWWQTGKWEFTEKQQILIRVEGCRMPAWIPDMLTLELKGTANGALARPGQTKSSSCKLNLEICYYSFEHHNSNSCSYALGIPLTGLRSILFWDNACT